MNLLFRKKEKQNLRRLRLKIGLGPPLIILAVFVLVALFADYLVPHNPIQVNLGKAFQPPFFQGGTKTYWLGTDQLGRDLLSRIIYGAKVSLIVSSLGILVAGIIGGGLGLLAGYKGGWFDTIISRITDIALGLPAILLAMILAVILGQSMLNVILVVVLVYWAHYTRMARADTLKIRKMDFVTLAWTTGCSDLTIIMRHILPNVANSLVVLATFNVGTVIILEATLSFLGAGVPPPTPSWGNITAAGRGVLVTAWWISFMPGLAITMVVLSGNMIGDWLRDKLDPRLRDL